MALLALGFINNATVAADTPRIRLSASKIDYEAYILTGVVAELEDGGFELQVGNVFPGEESGLAVSDLNLGCTVLGLDADTVCAGGAWSFTVAGTDQSWVLPINGEVDGFVSGEDGWLARSSLASGNLAAQITAQVGAEWAEAVIAWNGQKIQDLPAIALLPEQIQWAQTGTSAGQLKLRQPASGTLTVGYELDVNGLGFDSPDGRFAGENLQLHAAGSGTFAAETRAVFKGEIRAGDLLIDNFYVSFADASLQFEAQLNKSGDVLRFSDVRMYDGTSLDVAASGTLDLDRPFETLDYHLDRVEMHFPQAYERYMSSMASAWTLDGLTVTGSLLWDGGQAGGVSRNGVLDVLDLTIVDTRRGRFAVTGLEVHIQQSDSGKGTDEPESNTRRLDSRFSWRGLLLQRINLGPGEAAVNARPGQFSLASPLQLDVLGGRLEIEDLRVKLPGSSAAEDAEPEIRLFASLENLDMEQLTQALAWPAFGGTVSGRIPGVTLNDGVLAVEGEIEFKVFSGQVLLSGLRVERPFGVLPSLAADLEVRDLDMQQLTSTFSFGQISGRMSGFVHELRMLDWKPVAFDAWFGTPDKEQGSHEISRQAVNHLTTIGGGSATTALTGPVMKLFSNFSYKRLGLGCKLSNNVCEVRGLEDDAASVLIMEGAGIPKIMIRAFNRDMDWPTLVGGLTAASQGESIRIGDK